MGQSSPQWPIHKQIKVKPFQLIPRATIADLLGLWDNKCYCCCHYFVVVVLLLCSISALIQERNLVLWDMRQEYLLTMVEKKCDKDKNLNYFKSGYEKWQRHK